MRLPDFFCRDSGLLELGAAVDAE